MALYFPRKFLPYVILLLLVFFVSSPFWIYSANSTALKAKYMGIRESDIESVRFVRPERVNGKAFGNSEISKAIVDGLQTMSAIETSHPIDLIELNVKLAKKFSDTTLVIGIASNNGGTGGSFGYIDFFEDNSFGWKNYFGSYQSDKIKDLVNLLLDRSS